MPREAAVSAPLSLVGAAGYRCLARLSRHAGVALGACVHKHAGGASLAARCALHAVRAARCAPPLVLESWPSTHVWCSSSANWLSTVGMASARAGQSSLPIAPPPHGRLRFWSGSSLETCDCVRYCLSVPCTAPWSSYTSPGIMPTSMGSTRRVDLRAQQADAEQSRRVRATVQLLEHLRLRASDE